MIFRYSIISACYRGISTANLLVTALLVFCLQPQLRETINFSLKLTAVYFSSSKYTDCPEFSACIFWELLDLIILSSGPRRWESHKMAYVPEINERRKYLASEYNCLRLSRDKKLLLHASHYMLWNLLPQLCQFIIISIVFTLPVSVYLQSKISTYLRVKFCTFSYCCRASHTISN